MDIFTGLYNRNLWEEIIRKKIEMPFEDNFMVLIIDIVDLKRLNNGYGHMAGDEFVLILPDIKKREIENVMGKVSSYGNIAEAFKETFYLA